MTGKSLRGRSLLLLLTSLLFSACSQQPNVPPAPDPAAVLQAVPPADPEKYRQIHDMKSWRNPYLIVRADGVVLFDVADSAEIKLKPDDVLPALAQLPASNWPYGRVVAATENAAKATEQDAVAIRRNRGILGGILNGAHIAVEWVPGS